MISLAKGEWESFLLLLRARRALRIEGVDVSLPAPLRAVCRRVAYVSVPEIAVHWPGGRPGPNPDPLLPAGPMSLNEGELAELYVEVYAPRDAKVGWHEGLVRVRAGEGLRVPLRVRVYGFELPERHALRMYCNTHIRVAGELRGKLDIDALRGELVRNIAEHGGCPWDIALEPLRDVEWVRLNADGTVSIDFEAFDRAVERYEAMGFREFVMLPRSFRARTARGARMRPWLGLVPLTPQFDRAFSDYQRKMAQHLRQKGWIDRAVLYPWDEPNEREYQSFRHMLELIKGADRGLRTAVAGARMPLPEFYGLVDVWTTNLRWYDANAFYERIRQRLEAGDDVGGYGNNRYLLDFPLTWLRTWPWALFSFGLKHCGWWSVALWIGNPWTGFAEAGRRPGRNWAGAGLFVYPPPAGQRGLCDSLRWQVLREGVEDYDYLWLYSKRFGPERAMELSRRIAWGSYAWQFEANPAKLMQLRARIAEALER